MRICPRCRDEYEDHVETCVHCHLPTYPEGADLPPSVDQLLGRFHPLVVPRVVGLLEHRGVAHEVLGDADQVEVLVDREHRDALRAELAAHWHELVNRLSPDDHLTVVRSGARQPGWFDAPTSAWVDRDGRLQVEASDDDDATADASRMWGPTLVVVGSVLLLFGWYAADSAQAAVIGGLLLLVGLFLPR